MYQRITVDLDDHEQLSAAYQRLGEDAQARVGVLYAHGAHFSAGLDLGEVGPVVAERAAVAHLRELLPWVLLARRRRIVGRSSEITPAGAAVQSVLLICCLIWWIVRSSRL